MLPQLTNSCLREIVTILSPRAQATAALVSRRFASISRHELYREVELDEHQARHFFSALLSNRDLGCLVHKLVLAGTTYSCCKELAEKAFTTLVNLWSLHIFHPVNFLPLPHFPGHLRDFVYAPTANKQVIQFLMSQPSIESALFGELGLASCDSTLLPRLTDVSAPPEDLEVLVPSRPVQQVGFLYHNGDEVKRPIVSLEFLKLSTVPVVVLELQISQLLAAAKAVPGLPALLPELKLLIVYQDKTWGSASIPADDFGQCVNEMIVCINKMPTIRHLVVASTYGIVQAALIRRKFELPGIRYPSPCDTAWRKFLIRHLGDVFKICLGVGSFPLAFMPPRRRVRTLHVNAPTRSSQRPQTRDRRGRRAPGPPISRSGFPIGVSQAAPAYDAAAWAALDSWSAASFSNASPSSVPAAAATSSVSPSASTSWGGGWEDRSGGGWGGDQWGGWGAAGGSSSPAASGSSSPAWGSGDGWGSDSGWGSPAWGARDWGISGSAS
ncbi:hypothetical protein R3P38DRAFT_3164364 [Favolaschia claudopus]|uniref:F-box domain-containing protein n=1 Tax=Favolaschia claudopus TaxID=2862362 RepID=A0AAW0EF61_9AGAR